MVLRLYSLAALHHLEIQCVLHFLSTRLQDQVASSRLFVPDDFGKCLFVYAFVNLVLSALGIELANLDTSVSWCWIVCRVRDASDCILIMELSIVGDC